MMKIAYLINTYPSPSHSFVRREMAALEAQGIEIARFALRRPESVPLPDDQAEAAKTRYVLDVGAITLLLAAVKAIIASPVAFGRAIAFALRSGRRSDAGLFKQFICLLEACQLSQWCERDDIRHIHAHFGTNSTTVAMFSRLIGGQSFSFTAHGPEEFDRPQGLGLGDKISAALFVVAVCSYGRSQLYRWSRRDQWTKIHVVHCGVDQMFLTATRSPVTSRPRLLQVGRLCEQKGQLLLIEAARRLADRGVDFELALVGDGELRGEIEAMIARHSLGNRVKLLGWQSAIEIRQHMLDSRALIMPSFAEGLPVVLMESLALGRPVVSTFIAGIPELVDSKCGWLVPAGDVDALTDAMAATLAASTDELDAMGAVGRERVLERHDAACEATRLAALFRRAINGVVPATDEPVALAMADAASN